MSSDFQLTNRLRKDFGSLDDAKGRRRTGLFVAEGTKCVLELAVAYSAAYVFASEEWLAGHGRAFGSDAELVPSRPATLRELTRLSATPPVVAFFRIPEPAALPGPDYFRSNLVLALDRVQDPGNLGTILRTCDWMGVRTVIASADTVDAYNPKAVQATMGALARTKVVYTDLEAALKALPAGVPVYGTFLDGTDIYRRPLSPAGVLVMGNEGRGISDAVGRLVTERLFIPPFPADATAVESLNVGTATAIALSQFRSRQA
ncbi:MAG: RNA methyltransferase [Muribaculaceae bacterium]|nr:RNA methyltransferase [Muribaculaceae bacterium]